MDSLARFGGYESTAQSGSVPPDRSKPGTLETIYDTIKNAVLKPSAEPDFTRQNHDLSFLRDISSQQNTAAKPFQTPAQVELGILNQLLPDLKASGDPSNAGLCKAGLVEPLQTPAEVENMMARDLLSSKQVTPSDVHQAATKLTKSIREAAAVTIDQSSHGIAGAATAATMSAFGELGTDLLLIIRLTLFKTRK